MQTPALHQQLASYRQWKERLSQAVSELEEWLERHRRVTPEARAQLDSAQALLRRDRLEVAVVSQAARGRSELVNALFFADLGVRLLPAAAGRSSHCPVELLWDQERSEAYVRLLPVETRTQDTPVAALKADPRHWVQYPLDLQGPERMTATLRELLQTKTVSRAEAARLGLSGDGLPPEGDAPAGDLEIPKWRYAVVSFPHPLLELGLSVLAVPGGGVLGREPELALTLPAAQALLFVLAADLGVTREDLETWQQQLKGFQSSRQRAVLVALNKSDRLWDERRDGTPVEAALAARRHAAAEALGIGEDQVFAVSAQKGLVAKIRRDDGLLRRSALPALERQLALRLLETKRRLLGESLQSALGDLLEQNRSRVASRISRVKTRLDELERLRERAQAVVGQLLERTRGEQERYLRSVERFQQGREALLAESRLARQILEQEQIESSFARTRAELAHSWTTLGLGHTMTALIEELRRRIEAIAGESERIRKQVRETYREFRDELGLDCQAPRVFAPMTHLVEIELLVQEVEAFRRSPALIFSTRRLAIRRFEQQIASRAWVLFEQLRATFDQWIRDSLLPLTEAIEDHRDDLEQELDRLQQLGRSRDDLQGRIDSMQGLYVAFAQELTALRNIHNALRADPLAEPDGERRPRLVSG